MDQLQLSEMVEKYLRGELSGAEKVAFEEMRMNDPELDQMVVEYHAFLDQIENYGAIRRFKSNLYDTHQTLQEDGVIKELRIRGSARIEKCCECLIWKFMINYLKSTRVMERIVFNHFHWLYFPIS